MGTTASTAVSQQTSTTCDEDVLVTHPLHSSSRSVIPKRSTLRLRVDCPSVMEHGEEKKALASPQDVAAVIDKLPRAVLRRLQPKLRKLGFDIAFEKGGHRAVKLMNDLTAVRGDEEMLYNMLMKEEGLSSDVSRALVKEFSEKNASITEEISALAKRLDKQAAKKLKVQRATRGGEAAAAYRVAPVAAYTNLFTIQCSPESQERGAREVVSERKALKSLRANNNNCAIAAAAEEKTDSTVSNATVREVLLQQTSYKPERDGRFVKKADRDQREAKLMSPRQGSGSFKKRSGAGRKVVILGVQEGGHPAGTWASRYSS